MAAGRKITESGIDPRDRIGQDEQAKDAVVLLDRQRYTHIGYD